MANVPRSDAESPRSKGWDGDGPRVILGESGAMSPPPLLGERRTSLGSRVDGKMMRLNSATSLGSSSSGSLGATAQRASTSSGAQGDQFSTSTNTGNTNATTSSSSVENFMLKPADETRIEEALISAERKQTTGSVFSVRINMKKSAGVLGIGVKDMNQGILVVSMLKRKDDMPGPGEHAGLRLGDIIFGINYDPVRQGSKSLLKTIKTSTAHAKASRDGIGVNTDGSYNNDSSSSSHSSSFDAQQHKYLHVQCWRCHQLCSEPIPGALFPRCDDVIVKSYALYRNKIFSDWERWNFVEIILSHMLIDSCDRAKISPTLFDNGKRGSLSTTDSRRDRKVGHRLSINRNERNMQIKVIDLERNLLLAKCLRKALCVRIVHTKPTQTHDSVAYVLRIEDVETGLQWVVHRRYRDFYTLNEELSEMSNYLSKEVEFPQKRLQRNNAKLIESRIIALEQYVRKTLYLLSMHATMDPAASRSLRHVQKFLGVDKFIDCMYPPQVDDQRYIELLAFQFLNDFGSPACQQCVRFVNNVDLDALVIQNQEDGYLPALHHLSQALMEVEHFTLQQHQQQMHIELKERRPDMTTDQVSTFVRRCVRRQVEAAIFLPLRRTVFRIVFAFVAPQTQSMHDSLMLLLGASTDFFLVNSAATKAKSLQKAVRKFRDITRAYLPADQSQLLMHAAAAVMEMHVECYNLNKQHQQQIAAQQQRSVAKLLSNININLQAKSREDESASDSERQDSQGDESNSSTTASVDNDGSDSDSDDDNASDLQEVQGAWERSHGAQQFDKDCTSSTTTNGTRTDADDEEDGDNNDNNAGGDYTNVDAAGRSVKIKNSSNRNKRGGTDGRVPNRRWSIGVGSEGTIDTSKRQAIIMTETEMEAEATAENEAVVSASSVTGSTSNATSEVAMVDTSSSTGKKKKNRSLSVANATKSASAVASASPAAGAAGAVAGVAIDKAQRRPSATNTANTATATAVNANANASSGGIAALTFANRSRSSSMASTTSTSGSGSGSGGGTSGTGAKKHVDLLGSAALADPIQELFESRETVPALELYRDKERCRPITAGSSGPPDLTPLAQWSSDDEEDVEEEEEEGSPESTPAGTPAKSSKAPNNSSSSQAKTTSSKKKDRVSILSPSIEVKSSAAAAAAAAATAVGAGAGMGPPHTPGSPSLVKASAGMSISSVRDPVGPVRLRTSSASLVTSGDSPIGSGGRDSDVSNFGRGSASSVKDGEGGVTNTSGYYDSQSQNAAVSADDFLPMFTYVLVQANLPHLLIAKELMTTLVDDEETYGECGYYLATLEASLKHIADMAADFKSSSFSGAVTNTMGVLSSSNGGSVSRSRGSSMGSTSYGSGM